MSTCFNRFFLLTFILLGLYQGVTSFARNVANTSQQEALPVFLAEDVETVFALGLRKPLACVSQWDLELIPGISSEVALRIAEQRSNIIALAKSATARQALQSISGIGEMTATKVERYIDVTQSCSRPVLPSKEEP